ncbi:MAG: hypothetical protein F4X96_07685 [Gammaproteobacteria bacterium]|nr:hypothetical protein [Chromatiales bacterium]MYE49297.1 hypothetical protein [Gammaproteobacteria bacterium]
MTEPKPVRLHRKAPTGEEFVERARTIVPRIRERAGEAERLRTLPGDMMDVVREAGLLHAFVPERYGGYNLNWGPQIAAGRAVARGCASTAWLVSVVGSHAGYVGRMSEAAQDDVWGGGEGVLICTGAVPIGVEVRRAAGGFRVSGQWAFCSGVDHSAWALLRGTPVGEEDGPQHYMLFPSDEFSIVDDWFVSGMRATGSKSVRLEDAFVPEYRTLPLPELFAMHPPGSKVSKGPVYSYSFRAYAGSALMGPIIGAAEAAFDLFIEGLKESGEDLADPYVQMLVGETDAEVRAAGQLLDNVLETQAHYATRMLPVPMEHRVAFVRDRAFACRLSLRAVDRMAGQADLQQSLSDAPLQRYHRDIHAMCQQIGINWDRNMTNVARQILGLKTDIPYLNEA